MFTNTREKFEYTDRLAVWGSSAVDAAYHNKKSNELAVVLKSDGVYLYTDVNEQAFRDFANAWSKGRHYALTIKRKYGPGEYLGDVEDVNFVVPAADMGSTGTPKDLTYAEDAVVDSKPLSPVVGNVYNLGTVPVKSEARKHVVSFTVGDSDVVKTYESPADSVDKAAQALVYLGETLGLDFSVKGVYVSFE